MTPEEFGAFIKQKRKEAGLTQAIVANYLGVTKGAVSHWEKGRVEGIDPRNLFSLARLLEFNDEHLRQLFPDRVFNDLMQIPFDPEADAVRVMRVYSKLPPDIRKAVKAVIFNTAAVLEDRENLKPDDDGDVPVTEEPQGLFYSNPEQAILAGQRMAAREAAEALSVLREKRVPISDKRDEIIDLIDRLRAALTNETKAPARPAPEQTPPTEHRPSKGPPRTKV